MTYQWRTNDSIFNSSTNATNTTKIVTTNSDKYKINIILKRTTQEYFKKDFIVRFVNKYFIFFIQNKVSTYKYILNPKP